MSPDADRVFFVLLSHCCAMSCVTRQSSMLSLETEKDDDSESSDEDVSFADMLARLSKENEEREKDAGFFTDGDGDDSYEDKFTDDYSDAGDFAAPGEDKGEAPAPAENAHSNPS